MGCIKAVEHETLFNENHTWGFISSLRAGCPALSLNSAERWLELYRHCLILDKARDICILHFLYSQKARKVSSFRQPSKRGCHLINATLPLPLLWFWFAMSLTFLSGTFQMLKLAICAPRLSRIETPRHPFIIPTGDKCTRSPLLKGPPKKITHRL